MVYSLTWLPACLKEAGLKVAEVDGWESRGRAEMGMVLGVICHHTAGPATGNMPSLGTLVNGRTDLPGPLCHLGLGRDGTFYVVAAGRANHAGSGSWQGVTTGNTSFIGIEAENTGLPGDLWPAVQMDAYSRGIAAILKHQGRGAEWCAGHKEFALPKGRKSDPTFDMDVFRKSIAAILNGTAPLPRLIPASTVESDPQGPVHPTLRRGNVGPFVRDIQNALHLDADGFFGPKTEAAIRQFQRENSLVPDGIVGPKTWAALPQ